MPTNHTKKYDLNLWETEDAVLRTDFNADNEKIDTALAAKAEAAELTSLKQTVSSLSGTVSDHTNLLTKLGNCQVQV